MKDEKSCRIKFLVGIALREVANELLKIADSEEKREQK